MLQFKLFAAQVTGFLPYAVDMVLESGPFSAAFSISGQRFTERLKEKRQDFDDRFEQTFGLEAKVGVALLSNLCAAQQAYFQVVIMTSLPVSKISPLGVTEIDNIIA